VTVPAAIRIRRDAAMTKGAKMTGTAVRADIPAVTGIAAIPMPVKSVRKEAAWISVPSMNANTATGRAVVFVTR